MHLLFGVFLLLLTDSASAETLLQRCLGIVPGREPTGILGPTAATMSSCKRLPGWDLYEQAGQRFQAGDHAGAAAILQQSAKAGNPVAQSRLALMYSKGDGVPVDASAASRWLKAAADQGEPAAQDLLGTIYEYGGTPRYASYGVSDDWDLAAKYWQASASQGWVNGQFSLGRAYQYGIGVPLSLEEALIWYDKAAAKGHAQAKFFAKYIRDNHGFDGTSRDDDERALLGPLMGRTMPFVPPRGTVFHHLSERLAFVKKEFAVQERSKAEANYNIRTRQYRECKDAGRDNCILPGPPPK
ncbi:MAG TPA: tetratricopeptide repeat protein [Nitrospira sp.]|nr:tetratricopeptide repeat protein [Nitrospira sp.]